MEPLRIESRPALHLIGMQAPFISGLAPDTNAGDVIGPLWGAFVARLGEIERSDERACYGYSCYAAREPARRPDELLYLAAAAASPGAAVPEGMVAVDTAAALYAIFEHRGPIWTFGDTIVRIYRDWLPTSGYRGNGRGDVEVYDERWTPDGEDSVIELWIGVEPLAG